VRNRRYRGLTSSFLIVNEADNEWPLEGYVFWPYVGASEYGFVKPYLESPPPIQVDWQAGQIVAVGEFVASHGGDHNWYIQSHAPFGAEGDPAFADFENPFAFYDLALDDDGLPELAIRMEYMGADQAQSLFGGSGTALQSVRYSWDQGNDQSWDYSLGLLGRHEIVERVQFADFTVQTIPYARYAEWVAQSQWDTGVFLAVEGAPYWSSEGIYEGFVSAWRRFYLTGVADEPHLSQVQDVREGLRQEYTPDMHSAPRLYLSPVDRSLHLLGAWAGVWNVDGLHRVRYEDSDSDGYLDSWRLTASSMRLAEETGEEPAAERTLASLRVVGDYLLYGDQSRVKLVHIQVPPSLFETLPPANHAQWLALGEQLERHGSDFAADDLMAMVAQFEGPATLISGASLEAARPTELGFRFELHVEPGFQVLADRNELGAARLAPGSYMASWDGAFHLAPLTPPHLNLPQGMLLCEPSVPRQTDWVTIHAVLQNDGLRDVQSVPLRVYAATAGGEAMVLGEHEVAVAGGGEHLLEQPWWPGQDGEWTVWVEGDADKASPPDTALALTARLQLEVLPSTPPDMLTLIEPHDGVRFSWPVALLLAGAALAVVSAGVHVLTRLEDQTAFRSDTGEGR
jgi:hypothetical protein